MKTIKANKVLVIRLSSLGDVLLTTPVLRALKDMDPGWIIDFCTKPGFTETIKFNPNIRKVIEYQDNTDFTDTLVRENYDLVIDLHNNFRSRRLVKNLSAKILKISKPTVKKFLLVNLKINLFKKVRSIPGIYADTIPGLMLDNKGPEFFFNQDFIPPHKDNRVMGICPGSKHFTKMYPVEYFAELGNKLVERGFKVNLLGGRDDMPVCRLLNEQIKGSVNKCTDNDLIKTAENILECRAVICNDSGLMHLASALTVPVVAIFGSTVKEFGFFPYKVKNLVLENNSLSCRPCSHIGRSDCPKKHFNCMKQITPEIVLEQTLKFVKGNE
ncbi:MAG: glycosyltransferase family 9 protein [Melioribacteraceae bacterium]|nr:glycosyltransferase family 9 protein [Melioribacteraceae bacterium]